MSGTIAAVLKKAVAYLGTNKKTRKTVCGIALGIIFIVLFPVIAVLSLFSGEINPNMDGLQEFIAEQQSMGETTMKKIEENMFAEDYSELRIKEAQILYEYGLFGYGSEEGFTEKFVSCFDEEQTDEELIASVNEAFGTTILPEEFTEAVRELREEYARKGNAVKESAVLQKSNAAFYFRSERNYEYEKFDCERDRREQIQNNLLP